MNLHDFFKSDLFIPYEIYLVKNYLYNHYVYKGMDWKEAPQAFQISVLNFIFDKDEKDCISHYLMKNQNGRVIANMLNVIFMELPKIKLLADDIYLLTPKQMWGKFFL